MLPINSLSPFFQIGTLLNIRFEAFIDNKWQPTQLFNLASDTPVRPIKEDMNKIPQLKSVINEFYDIIQFKEHKYVFPKAAKEPGSIILMHYSTGIYVVTQDDGYIMSISLNEAKSLLISYPQKEFFSLSYKAFFRDFIF